MPARSSLPSLPTQPPQSDDARRPLSPLEVVLIALDLEEAASLPIRVEELAGVRDIGQLVDRLRAQARAARRGDRENRGRR